MGLTADVQLALGDAGLIDFFEQHREAFREMADRSYSFAHDNISETGIPLRRDDVSKGMVIALTTNESLRDYLAGKSLRQRFWYQRFADLIVETLWEELEYDYNAGQ